MSRVVSESEFYSKLVQVLRPRRVVPFRSVSGPGRSGAIAAVYASHVLGVPMIPPTMRSIPAALRPLLVIDTARMSGSTLRSLGKRMGAEETLALFFEPPRLKFWYEFEGVMIRERQNRINEETKTIVGRLRNTIRGVALAPTGRREEAMGVAIGESDFAVRYLGIDEHSILIPYPESNEMTNEQLFAAARALDGKPAR